MFTSVQPNVVQSIRAFHVIDLQNEAIRLGQRFLYAYCAAATSKQQVLATIAERFEIPRQLGRNFPILTTSLTETMYAAGPQQGFVVVLEQLPNVPGFGSDARESLLDVFRDAAEFWAEKGVAFRVFYSFE